MAGGGGIFGRAISYVVNEIVVEGLANSPAFQRFAVRTSKRIEDISLKAEQVKGKVSDHVKEISEKVEESFKN